MPVHDDNEVALRQAVEHAARLQRLATALGPAITAAEVARALVAEARGALGAAASFAWLLDERGEYFELVCSEGFEGMRVDAYRRFPASAPLPLRDALAEKRPLMLETLTDYPAAQRGDSPYRGWAVIPLIADGEGVGGVSMSFAQERHFTGAERTVLETMAAQASLALTRCRAFQAERASRRRSAFIAEASAILSASLDHQTTLRSIARLAVPDIADWCTVELRTADGAIETVAVAHKDERLAEVAREFRRRFPVDARKETGIARVIRDGKPAQSNAITPALLEQFIKDPEELEFLKRLEMTATLSVPIVVREAPIGAISLVMSESRRRFSDADVEMAIELGRRAGLAIDNARLYAAATEADRRKDEFLAMLGHELRNPLAPILTALQLMQLRGQGELREVKVIDRQVRHLMRLVDDLLDVSRITRGKVQLAREPLEIASVIAKAIEMAAPLFEQKAHNLDVDVAREGLWVNGDPVRLAQVFGNLLTNAAKYTDEGGRIRVAAAAEGGQVTVRIADDGIGIAPDMLERVFDLFVQANRTVDRSRGGLGIGLTLAKSLVEQHGGTICAFSEGQGKGTEVTVRLPALERPSAAAAPAKSAPPKRAPHVALRVLIVDDNLDAAQVLADALRELGHEVEVAHDGPEALGRAKELEPQVALLDIGLPVMDGYELGRALKAAHPSVRLFAVTGYGQDSDKKKSHEAGFEAHFVKPIDVGAIGEQLSSAAPPVHSSYQGRKRRRG